MSIQIFVHAEGANGDPLIADHYQFHEVPRLGEHVVVTEDGEEFVLRVTAVSHFAHSKDDSMPPVSYIQIKCDAAIDGGGL
jgi:hypothetical protein